MLKELRGKFDEELQEKLFEKFKKNYKGNSRKNFSRIFRRFFLENYRGIHKEIPGIIPEGYPKRNSVGIIRRIPGGIIIKRPEIIEIIRSRIIEIPGKTPQKILNNCLRIFCTDFLKFFWSFSTYFQRNFCIEI